MDTVQCSTASRVTVGTLPAGFRPPDEVSAITIGMDGWMFVETNGDVQLVIPANANTYGDVTYPAWA